MGCGHTFHDLCLTRYSEIKGVHFADLPCPTCRHVTIAALSAEEDAGVTAFFTDTDEAVTVPESPEVIVGRQLGGNRAAGDGDVSESENEDDVPEPENDGDLPNSEVPRPSTPKAAAKAKSRAKAKATGKAKAKGKAKSRAVAVPGPEAPVGGPQAAEPVGAATAPSTPTADAKSKSKARAKRASGLAPGVAGEPPATAAKAKAKTLAKASPKAAAAKGIAKTKAKASAAATAALEAAHPPSAQSSIVPVVAAAADTGAVDEALSAMLPTTVICVNCKRPSDFTKCRVLSKTRGPRHLDMHTQQRTVRDKQTWVGGWVSSTALGVRREVQARKVRG